LLYTHTLLWFATDSPRLASTAGELIGNAANEALVSIASLWEIAITITTGKLIVGQLLGQFIAQQLIANRFGLLPISIAHALPIAELPPHHRDPFDHLLIAQALAERLPLVSADALFDAYPITRLC
jgi:PIN domain nuclease of toxin-antitoxin system